VDYEKKSPLELTVYPVPHVSTATMCLYDSIVATRAMVDHSGHGVLIIGTGE
jgi:hypothetical protein